MSLTKFSDSTKWMRADGKVWCVHGHKRGPHGTTELATAAVFQETTKDGAKPVEPLPTYNARQARSIGFAGSPRAKRRRIDLSTLRRRVGRATWGDGWPPRPRSILGGVFDCALLARTLSAVPADSGRVTLEVLPMKVGTYEGRVLRVIGRGWRAVLASRREDSAPPLDLTVPSRGEGT